ncbi:MAG: hypothetical protein COB65_00680 [Thalassobium sp.]|uniref:hypothetical protein n=1 Tax=Octadecabacter sp. SW4 TaxID=2602067 RepID=UPI000C112DA9|nr:hypothetical protein [Octadecabacter sp. SW4]PHQ86739.1 MAG: hypothetical protein COB65_00680 [Thalassobium sp.]QEE34741.1 hypothetical protein FTO60_02840 [Octadecabacter sp. SW4]|tara:strand:+ start:603 stop:872 length:270 start_codon:yes stop_codon:yes gene_type:complete
MALVRLIVFGFLGLSVVYICISLYSRSVRREKLEGWWAEDHPDDLDSSERTAYIEKGMAKYESGFRKKLIVLVYVIPTVIVGTILYFVN